MPARTLAGLALLVAAGVSGVLALLNSADSGNGKKGRQPVARASQGGQSLPAVKPPPHGRPAPVRQPIQTVAAEVSGVQMPTLLEKQTPALGNVQPVRSQGPALPVAEKDQTAATTKKPLKPSKEMEPARKRPFFDVKRIRMNSEEDLRKQLADVPELAFESATRFFVQLRQEARSALKKGKPAAHAEDSIKLVQRIIRSRPDLMGLPLRLGNRCRLGAAAARHLETFATDLREAMTGTGRASRERGQQPVSMGTFSPLRYAMLHSGHHPKWYGPEAIPAWQQILMSEGPELRMLLVEKLVPDRDQKASVALAQRALFDLDAGIRKSVLRALNDRPRSQFREVLLEGLRYPWAPVANHAAEALVALQMDDTIPTLVDLLEKGDPCIACEQEVHGKPVFLVRELVRVNHLRSCYLCHAPSTFRRDPVRGLVPLPSRPLPSATSRVYYGGRSGMFVRADVTYLRQDFAVMQPVENPERWPKMQRFDYLVRVRPPTPEEWDIYRLGQSASQPSSPCEHQKAVLFALRELTGKDLGTRAQDWRQFLRSASAKPRRATE
jgi:hypothetical protein